MQQVKAQVTGIYDWLCETEGEKHLIGGAGSGKSHGAAQYLLIDKLSKSPTRILVLRKTLPSLKLTAWELILTLIKEYKIPCKINKTDMVITIGASKIYFKSLDDPEKIKSAEFDVIWIEEATDLNVEDYRQLKLRLGRTKKGEMILTYNPISQFHWLKTEVIDKGEVLINRSTYRNNPFLSPEFKAQLEQLAEQDMNYYRIYALGEWGTLENIIYTNWDTAWKESEGETIYGLDFGYTNPSALIEIKIEEQDLYIREVFYQPRLLNSDIIARLETEEIKSEIYADSASADKIDEIFDKGYNIHPASKSVKDGIDMVKRFKLHIHPDSVNLVKEITGYSWKTNKDGQVLEEPVKFNDHALDATRYAIYTHIKDGVQFWTL